MESYEVPIIPNSLYGRHNRLQLDSLCPMGWDIGLEKPTVATVAVGHIEEPHEETYTEIPVLYNSPHKTYMSVHMITDRTSDQWNYIHSSGKVETDGRGFLICDEEYIGVALGYYFGEIGTKYIFTLSTGEELKLCKVEHKALEDTTEDGFLHFDGSVIEFVVDPRKEYMQRNVWENGLIFSGNFNNSPEFEGEIVRIRRIEE